MLTATAFTADTTADSAGGHFTVTAASAGLTGANFSETNIAGAPTQDVIASGGTQTVAVGTTLARLSVTIEDGDGNPVLASGVAVTFTAPAGGASGTFADTSTNTTTAMTNGNGVATARAITPDRPGSACEWRRSVASPSTSELTGLCFPTRPTPPMRGDGDTGRDAFGSTPR